MKSFQTPSVTLILIVAFASFAACSNDASKEGAGNADTSAAVATTTTVNANDGEKEKLEANKKIVIDFTQSLFRDRDSTAIDKYIADNIIQHNFVLADGKEWLKNRLNPYLRDKEGEKMKVEIKQIAAEGDKVWTLSREEAPNGKIFARAEIWRIENGKIAEVWLVNEAESKSSLNKNGMF